MSLSFVLPGENTTNLDKKLRLSIMPLYEFNIVYLYWVVHEVDSLINTYFDKRHG